jgi:hypothetical protein
MTLGSYRVFDEEEITDIFSFHAPTLDQVQAYESVNAAFIECVNKVAPLMPDGLGKTAAIRALNIARMQVNAAIALQGKF